MSSENKKGTLSSYIILHFVIIIYGFTAIIGRFITIPALNLVWYRMLIATVCFAGWILISKKSFKLPKKISWQLLGVGSVVGLHWITFFGAVKLSNVSVTLGCMASATLFTSLLEPLILRRKIAILEVFVGTIIIGGLYMIFQFETKYLLGISVALCSAFLASLFTVLNGQFASKADSAVISGYEMFGGTVLVSIILFARGSFDSTFFALEQMDWVWVTLLATVCTAFAFAANIYVMKRISPFSVVLAINMEPIYGILLALLFFKESERMSLGFYIGTAIIILSVILYPIIKSRNSKIKLK